MLWCLIYGSTFKLRVLIIRLKKIIELESHIDFDVKNPNRVRSIYGAFGMLNLRNFHHKNGSGYEFLGRAVEKLDSINPQIASRLCSPLTRWTKFDEEIELNATRIEEALRD